MCLTVAPDCEGSGIPYGPISAQIQPEVKPILYTEPRSESTEHPNLGTITEDDVHRRYGTYSRNRFFDRNESDSLWPNRVLTTAGPTWQIANSYPISNQYSPSTDSGILFTFFMELVRVMEY